jgi:hypothetical protein
MGIAVANQLFAELDNTEKLLPTFLQLETDFIG